MVFVHPHPFPLPSRERGLLGNSYIYFSIKLVFPVVLLQGVLILSFWLVQNLSEGFPTSGNDNKTNKGCSLLLIRNLFFQGFMSLSGISTISNISSLARFLK